MFKATPRGIKNSHFNNKPQNYGLSRCFLTKVEGTPAGQKKTRERRYFEKITKPYEKEQIEAP